MTIEFHCPNCEKLLRTADSKAGLSAKCPQCGQPVTVPAAPPPADDAAGQAWENQGADAGWTPPAAVPAGAPQAAKRPTSFCPTCGEPTKDEWVVCGYCGESLQRGGLKRGESFVGEPRPLFAGDILSRAWTIFQKQMGVCIGALIIPIVISYVFQALQQGLMMGAGFVGGNNQGAAVGAFAVVVVVMLGSIVAQWWLQLGQLLIFLRVAKGEQVEISDLFKGGPYLLRFIGVAIVLGLLSLVALVVVSIPFGGLAFALAQNKQEGATAAAIGFGVLSFVCTAIWISLVFWPAPWLLVDRDGPGMSCLSEARDLTRGHRLSMIVVGLLAALVSFAGLLACCVGALFTIPIGWLMMAIAYCDLTGQPTARV